MNKLHVFAREVEICNKGYAVTDNNNKLFILLDY